MTTTNVTTTIGARFTMNSLNERPVAPAMMMFGGSPIRVAVPPMFEAITSITISGIGSMSRASARRKVIGTIRRIVVRLSRKADSTAVVTASERTTRNGSPARELPCADCDVVVDPALLGQIDQDHHPGEQPDRVEVDRLDCLLLAELADKQDDDRGAREGHFRTVDALRRDQRKREQECDDGNGHVRLPTSLPGAPCRAYQRLDSAQVQPGRPPGDS